MAIKHKCKITVVKRLLFPDVAMVSYGHPIKADEYSVEGIGPCHFDVGQEFICDRHREPYGFCGEAWKCVQHYAYALYHGSDNPCGEGWMRIPGVVIATYNDGLWPVTFKLERIETE